MALSDHGTFSMEDGEAGWKGKRRERLLAAASRVFARNGYEQTTMDQIAGEAGIGKPTIYRYFDGKGALFVAVFEDALDRLEAKLAKVLARESTVERRLHGMVAALVPTFRDHLVSLRFLSEDAAAIDQSKRRIFRDRRARIAGHLARALSHPDLTADPLRTAHLVIGMIWSGTAGLAVSDQELAAEISHLVLHGIEPRSGFRLPQTVGNGLPAPVVDAQHGTGRVSVS